MGRCPSTDTTRHQDSLETDLHCSSAELVYGTTLRLPGEFFEGAGTDNPVGYVTKLMKQLRPVPTWFPRQCATFMDPALATCAHVFLWHDAVRSPLQPPYDGPYHAGSQTPRKVISINCVMSLDHLKPAHMESPANHPASVPGSGELRHQTLPPPALLPLHHPPPTLEGIFVGHYTSRNCFASFIS